MDATAVPAVPAEAGIEAQRAGPRAPEVSIVVPVYNEAQTLRGVLEVLLDYVEASSGTRYEIIVVDDGSTDDSGRIAELFCPRVKVQVHAGNRGYGAALVSGAEAARGRHVVFFDSDGQHTIEQLEAVLSRRDAYDMVVGARRGHEEPLIRRAGRRLLHALASYLADSPIVDLNSGLRVVEREKFRQYEHLYPRGFSLSSTITLAFLKSGYSVGYVPIPAERRKGGRSTVSLLRDGWQTAGLIVRLIMLFAPQKIFLPVAAVLFLLGASSFAIEVYRSLNIGENTAVLLVSSLLVLLFGLLADQIAAIRRELRRG